MLFNVSLFQPAETSQIFKTLLFGIRFDFAVIYYINLPFIIMHLIPGNYKQSRIYQVILITGMIVVNSILLLINFIDIEYFRYTNKRSGMEMLDMLFMSTDTGTMIFQYIRDYWLLVIIWSGCIFLFKKFFPVYRQYNFKISETKIRKYIFLPLTAIFIFLCGFGCARGLKKKPLRIISANEYTSQKYSPLLLNTPFTIINTIGHKNYAALNYLNPAEADSLFSPVKSYYRQGQKFKKDNIVIIILESFSAEFVHAYNDQDVTYTPFLDSLINEGLISSYSFANACRSIDALPSIISSFPPLTGSSFVGSIYSVNKISSLASFLNEEGYSTSFFHGGQNGTMAFDNFCDIVNIDNYYGLSEYPDKNDYDGSWGIYDEEFLQFSSETLSKTNEPFFACIFTLSSHPPYNIPERYKGKFIKTKPEIIETIQYTDYALKKFFETASKAGWYKNTLFVICADHTTVGKQQAFNTELGRFRIPIVYFHPGNDVFKGKLNRISQQLDIMPTILDYLNYDKKFVSFGESILVNKNIYSVNYKNGIYQIIDSVYILSFNGEKSISLYNYKNDSLLKNNVLDKYQRDAFILEMNLKAFIQSYSNRLVKNKLTDTTRVN